ncbi:MULTISPECIES: pyridoxal phosphate-dependent aminotransferase [Pseudomonas]|jgi:aspartate/methionine/tyrosine aminotransferase|uniref:pyridoxal phosphate-dependent aminotransferase n=1 Tax=Pseudomonas TaxID=286 RepID=UPI000717217E|nr:MULTISPECIES: aminotransferase class I/II-fold pyridoxal phosphate-dependent enzyme [Pseudomonas]SUD43054.1 putative aminotransferase YugH [Pseudomonas fluorescens]MBJ2252319.1 aminotransferase class I/II-fold pyridoxal phosphate-dependent enzyme [Pseudomonas sp. MF6784]MBJ2263749.1 aminotransferase class I/II-fold pyridoxal phosphate-dependent enzyme [Pseudomonas sp. MF6787]MBJ2291015.1 aminotransferase class I/II-fold pyridoxal phosphate-dependent enzyme [Pseudomonas sp. MF5691]MBU4631123
MRYSPFVERISGESVSAWDIHYAAVEARGRGEDVIVLSVGDPDFATASAICETAVDALRAGDTHYTHVLGRPALREAIAAKQSRLQGIAVHADNVALVAGAQNGLFATSLCLFSHGDEVLVPEPMYLTYEACIHASGARIATIEQPAANGFRLTRAALEKAITAKTRGIALATPCNPTGNVYSREELEWVAEVAREHDLWVISDEVYGQITYDQPHLSIASLPGMAERTVVLNSLSKTHAMTGWRVGWVVAPTALVGHLDNLLLCMLYGLPGFIQEAAIKALELDDEVVSDARTVYRRRRDLVVAGLGGIADLDCRVPQAGMFMLVDVRRTGLSSMDFAWQLFRATGVSVLDAQAFGASAEGFVRISFTVADDTLKDACQRIAGFVEGLRANR